jgi:hypothetical protein
LSNSCLSDLPNGSQVLDNFFIDLFIHVICSRLLLSSGGVKINSQHSLEIDETIDAKSESS